MGTKLTKSFLILTVVGVLIVPSGVWAQTEDFGRVGFSLIDCGVDTNKNNKIDEAERCGFDDFIRLLNRLLGYLVYLAGLAATIAFLWGGIILLTSGGSESKRGEAKTIIWSAVVGLIIVLAAFLIVRTIVVTLVDDGSSIRRVVE